MSVDPYDVEESLKRVSAWQPPPDFVRGTVQRASAIFQEWPDPERRFGGRIVLAAASGLAAAALAYAIGTLLFSGATTLVEQSATAVPGYTMFLELSTQMVTARAVQMAWISAGLSVAGAASLTLRARG